MLDNRRVFLALACISTIASAQAFPHYNLQRRFATPHPSQGALLVVSAPTLLPGFRDAVCVSAQPSTTSRLPTGSQQVVVCTRHVPARGQLITGQFLWVANQQWEEIVSSGRITQTRRWSVPVYELAPPASAGP